MVIEKEGRIINFGLAYSFRPEATFDDTVKFTYWIMPSFTGNGLGTKLYEFLKKTVGKMVF